MMEDNYSWEYAYEADLDSILNLYNYYILNSNAIYEDDAWTYEYIQDWFRKKQFSDDPIMVVREGETDLIAFATYGEFRVRKGYEITREHSVYVDPKHSGKGIGKYLMTELIELAREKGVKNLIGVLDSVNEGSIKFHEKLGFEEVARFKDIALKKGQQLTAVFMQKVL